MKPVFKIVANGVDITAKIAGNLKSLRVVDGRGLKADSVVVKIDDTESGYKWPSEGATLEVSLGFDGLQHYKGKYVVDELAHDGPPDQLIISAKPADFVGGLKVQRNHSYHDTTLGEIVSVIAQRNGLVPAISAKFNAQKIQHLDQTNESDLNLITRLAVNYDAVGKPANGRLLFTGRGDSQTASGQKMPVVDILRTDISRHRYVKKKREGGYTGVKAFWLDKEKAQTMFEVSGSDGNLKALKKTHSSQSEAAAAAGAEWGRIGRSEISLDLTCKQGLPELVAECVANVQGIRAEIDGEYIVTEVVHTLSASGGLSSMVKAEAPAAA